MLYGSTMPFWNKRIMDMIWSKDAVPAIGIASGKEDETPGRDLSGKGEIPRHLTKEDLTAEIENILDRELDFGERRFTLREIYLFALNDARVALMMDAALESAFESKTIKKG